MTKDSYFTNILERDNIGGGIGNASVQIRSETGLMTAKELNTILF